MSDEGADPELLALLAQSLGRGPKKGLPPSTGVLESAEYVYDNALDVSVSSAASKAAAALLYEQLQQRQYSTYDWSKHELHPKPSGGEATVNFIFAMSLLNFSFWSDLPEEQRFAVEYHGKRWTGYWSLVAALQRGLEEGYPITTPSSWSTLTDDDFAHIFRSATQEPMPLLTERITLLRTASHMSPSTLVDAADHSAARLVNLLTSNFPDHFSDTATYGSRTISLHKRAQILVADLWACFRGQSFGEFDDVDTALTMFADYRVPQMLQRLGVLWYSPRLEGKIRRKDVFESGEKMEVEVRGCSIWAVELLRREIVRRGGGRWEVEVEDDDNDAIIPDKAGFPDASRVTDEPVQPVSTLGTPDAAIDGDTPDHNGNKHVDQQPTTVAEGGHFFTPADSNTHIPSITSDTAPPPPSTETPSIPTATATATVTPTAPQPPKRTKTISVTLNAILLDYLLYDTAKEVEARELAEQQEMLQATAKSGGSSDGRPEFDPDGPKTLPHHRCRSIWY